MTMTIHLYIRNDLDLCASRYECKTNRITEEGEMEGGGKERKREQRYREERWKNKAAQHYSTTQEDLCLCFASLILLLSQVNCYSDDTRLNLGKLF